MKNKRTTKQASRWRTTMNWSGARQNLGKAVCLKLRRFKTLVLALTFATTQVVTANAGSASAVNTRAGSELIPTFRDLNLVSEELSTLQSRIQFSDSAGNKIEFSNVMQTLDSGQSVYMSSTEANPNSFRISKAHSGDTNPVPSLVIEQFVGSRIASTTVLRVEVNSELMQNIYRRLYGEGKTEQVTKTELEKLESGTIVHSSKNSRLVCEEGRDAVTGKPLRHITLGIGPNNIGTLFFLLLPGLVLYFGHPARVNNRRIVYMFLIAAFLMGTSGALYLIGSKTGCN